MAVATKPAKKTAALKANKVFTAEEREAMEAAVADRKRGKVSKADGEAELRAALAKLGDEDRALGERLHAIVTAAAPDLWPRTWYGMPAYAKNDKVVCFFQPAGKFKARYSTLGFSDQARLDDGNLWPNAYALTKIGPVEERRITELVKKAVG
jgi:uncharacterized protein YdhG (YjbR/CyaY superfamily)